MRISDWSSDVCSSDLLGAILRIDQPQQLACRDLHASGAGLLGNHRDPRREPRNPLQYDLFGALVRLGHGGLVGLASNLEVCRIDVHDGTTSHPNQGCQLVNATRQYGLAQNRTPEVGASAGAGTTNEPTFPKTENAAGRARV